MNHFRQLANRLKKEFPGVKMSIRRGTVAGDRFADTDLIDDTFVIVVDKNIEESFACFLLVHEVGHPASWHIDSREHGPAFWKAVKKAYAVYVAWCAEGN